jgi:hypothetical protein
MLTAHLTVVSIRCPSVVYVNCTLIVLNISCPSVNYVNNPSMYTTGGYLMLKAVGGAVKIKY